MARMTRREDRAVTLTRRAVRRSKLAGTGPLDVQSILRDLAATR